MATKTQNFRKSLETVAKLADRSNALLNLVDEFGHSPTEQHNQQTKVSKKLSEGFNIQVCIHIYLICYDST
jgi:hypothetical protein